MIIVAALCCSSIAVAEAPRAAESQATRERPRGTYVVVDPGEAQASTISNILFVDFCSGGCVLSPGSDDAGTNTTSLVDGPTVLSEFAHGDQVWNDTIACLREVYAPYDVEITTGTLSQGVVHHKAILAGTHQEAGKDISVAGVAPLASDCSPIDNTISLTFANSIGADWRDLCWTLAQESAHAFGLEHVFDCHDPMTYLPGCGVKYFRDSDMPCGEQAETPCICGTPTQNSHRKLTSVFGEGILPAPPQLTVDGPAAGNVANGFAISATAQHDRGISRFELELNGWRWESREGALSPELQDFNFTTPAALPDGYIDIELVAYGDLGLPSSHTVTVLKGSACTSDERCAQGQLCEEGRCYWPEPTKELGESCRLDQDCVSELCMASGEEKRCTEACPLNEEASCPGDFDCVPAAQGSGFCWAPGRTGGCCSVSKDQGTPWHLGFYVLIVVLLLKRRRGPSRLDS